MARHARAHHVALTLQCKGGRLLLTVRDDGIGFDVSEAQERSQRGDHLGIMSMEGRAHLLNGDFEIASAPGDGSEVRVSLPVAGTQHNDSG